eukprot:UN03890
MAYEIFLVGTQKKFGPSINETENYEESLEVIEQPRFLPKFEETSCPLYQRSIVLENKLVLRIENGNDTVSHVIAL